MFRTFQRHPGGPIGSAILLLRTSAALTLASWTAALVHQSHALAVIACTVAGALLLGIGTRPATILALGVSVLSLQDRGWASITTQGAFALELAALFVTGPGAFSADALRFGRKTFRMRRGPATKV